MSTKEQDDDPFFAKIHFDSYPTGGTGILSVSFSIPESYATTLIDALVPSYTKGLKKNGRVVPVIQELYKVGLEVGNKITPLSDEQFIRQFSLLSLEPIITIEAQKEEIKQHRELNEVQNSWLEVDAKNTPEQFRNEILQFNKQSFLKLNDIKVDPIKILQTVAPTGIAKQSFYLKAGEWRTLGKLASGSIFEIFCSFSSGHPDICICKNANLSSHGYPGSCTVADHLYMCSSNINSKKFKIPRSPSDFWLGAWSYGGTPTECTIAVNFLGYCPDVGGPVVSI